MVSGECLNLYETAGECFWVFKKPGLWGGFRILRVKGFNTGVSLLVLCDAIQGYSKVFTWDDTLPKHLRFVSPHWYFQAFLNWDMTIPYHWTTWQRHRGSLRQVVSSGFLKIWNEQVFNAFTFEAWVICSLGMFRWWFQMFLCSPLDGEMESNMTCAYFSDGLVQPPHSSVVLLCIGKSLL